jgi:hypothetical protein
MKVNVRFRFNVLTGQVEEFVVDDIDSRLPAAEHEREHDRITHEVAGVIEQHARIVEMRPGAEPRAQPAPPVRNTEPSPEAEPSPTPRAKTEPSG